MPTIVGILTFMSRINSVLSRGEHEKHFITSGGPGVFTVLLLSTDAETARFSQFQTDGRHTQWKE